MNSPRNRPLRVDWLRQVGARVLVWWPAKMIGIILGMAVFFALYFLLLLHPVFPVTVMPLTAVDRLVGFRPEAFPLYLSLWFYVSLAPGLLTDRRELVSYFLAVAGLSVIGFGIFLVWPTAVPRPEVNWLQHPAFAFLKSVDASGNACPSLHVAFAVFSAAWFERILRQMGATRVWRALNWAWCLGILYSTVAIHQHVFLDVVAGIALGAVVAFVHLRWLGVSAGDTQSE